jgi:hypothetical protein
MHCAFSNTAAQQQYSAPARQAVGATSVTDTKSRGPVDGQFAEPRLHRYRRSIAGGVAANSPRLFGHLDSRLLISVSV